eukprot:CAMPEP_0179222238 /NCGR_PEP_ID=MMETSP0797-20121207/6615_1 /TAXON_ID=47934 /ORGANISM="Dinophysis acuminata, Strain DAEP01" /LENGTH=410 /DNA_ID=CAMNT_0020929069 /DNA_START=37 /DNA_END=1269 /DNA_ORIENTATION=+
MACSETSLLSPFQFDLPAEDVREQVVAAFGEAAAGFGAAKWDLRVQALKGIGSIFKELCTAAVAGPAQVEAAKHPDPANCFRAACLALHAAMREKVIPVLFAAHELYHLVFEHCERVVSENEARAGMGVLFPNVVAKLGDLNTRLHESASTAIVFSANRHFFGLAEVLPRLETILEDQGGGVQSQQRMKVQACVLDTVADLLKRFPGHRGKEEGGAAGDVFAWTPSEIAPFITKGVELKGALGSRLQAQATELAVTICGRLGRGSLHPLLGKLSPTARDLVMSRFEAQADLEGAPSEGEEEDGDEMMLDGANDLCVVGVGLQPQTPTQHAEAAKPPADQTEEILMDKILEDAGLVFKGQGLTIAVPVPSLRPESELDRELRSLGLDSLDLDNLASWDVPQVPNGSGPMYA